MTIFAFNLLLNAVWQIPLVFCAAYLAVRLTRHNGPQWEHRIWITALFFELILPLGHLHFKPFVASLLSLFPTAVPAATGSVRTFTGTAIAVTPTWHLPSLVISLTLIAWVVTTAYFTTRLLWRLHKTSTLRGHAHAVSAQE